MGVQWDKTSIIVCSVIGVVGLLAAIFGFSAEGTKLTPYTILVTDDYECLYPPNPAAGLGICAAIFLLLSQITISVVGGCCGCCKTRAIPSETKKIVGIICAVFSWIAALIAMGLFYYGASLNSPGVRATSVCHWIKDGVFAGAGILALAATGLSITSFIMLRQNKQGAPAPAPAVTPATGTPNNNNMTAGYVQSPSPGVVVGQPLLPMPQSNKPQEPNDYPVKPHQAYQYQQQQPHQAAVAPTHHQSHPPQGYYVQNLQPPPPPAAAAAAQPAQHNVSHAHAPNHQHQHQLPPVAAVACAAAAAPAVLQPAAVAMVQQPVPQVGQLPQVPLGGAEIPGALPLQTAGSGGAGLATVIRNEVARQGVKMAAQVVSNAIFADNTVAGGVLSAMTDSAGTSGGDAVEVAN